MSNEKLIFTKGLNHKPVSTEALIQILSSHNELTGECFFGYPLIATPEGKYSLDATLVDPAKGVVIFDLVEGNNLGDYKERQDDLANKLEAKFKLHRELLRGRSLAVPLNVITFCTSHQINDNLQDELHPLANEGNLQKIIDSISWHDGSPELYKLTLSAVESLSSIRKGRQKREVIKEDSRGAKLQRLEDSIATLDHRQNKAVIETVDGVQRIRGLAGSGKTIVLALKAAYLHTQYPNWRIAVTFNTRSLKGQFRRLINNFCIEQSGEEPDWTKIRIVNAWGAPGGDERDGIYYEFCRLTGADFFDFKMASYKFGGNDKAFVGACKVAITKAIKSIEVYDAILVDEAQDFDPSFLEMCYLMLKYPKRLVYAYDELQNLSGTSLPPPEEIFGKDKNGNPLVSFDEDQRRDVILQKCYRNSRPVLVTAHALGFGINRRTPEGASTGLVQMFDHPGLWEEIGYRVAEGELKKGNKVTLERTEESSPRFLEEHSPIDDLVQFICFEDEDEQTEWLIEQIKKNLAEDELRHDDIIVIHPDPITARKKTGFIRSELYDKGIQNHLAGVDTGADVFFRQSPSVTFTGIYRAKGNEAGMVYVINSQDCDDTGAGLSTLRNRLFTAMTRSKAWVRVLGYGQKMQNLIAEFNQLKANKFKLQFVYPGDEILSKLRIVHRDLSPQEKKRLEQKKHQIANLVKDLEDGNLLFEDLDEETRKKLKKLFVRN